MTGNKMPDRGQQTEASREKPFNNKMNILKALGILMAVGVHAGIRFLPWFPPDSFNMPLFFFISGYFFHDKDFISFMKSKVKHLVIPLLSWNLIFGILCTVLLSYGLVHFGHPLSLKTLFIDSFTYGQAFEFNAPTWFVGTLVEVQIVYWLLHRFFKRNHVILLLLTLLFYLAAWTMADNQVHEFYGYGVLALEKVLFVLIFYEMGAVYHLFLEKKDLFSMNRIACLILFNGFLLGFVNPNLNTIVALMKVPHQMFLPLLTALSGIYFYLQIAELLKDKVKGNLCWAISESIRFPLWLFICFSSGA